MRPASASVQNVRRLHSARSAALSSPLYALVSPAHNDAKRLPFRAAMAAAMSASSSSSVAVDGGLSVPVRLRREQQYEVRELVGRSTIAGVPGNA
jgi:hypothetical protein